MSQSHGYSQSKRLSAALAWSVIAVFGFSGCGNPNQARVLIKTGQNAGKYYAPSLVGGATAEECIRQGICTRED